MKMTEFYATQQFITTFVRRLQQIPVLSQGIHFMHKYAGWVVLDTGSRQYIRACDAQFWLLQVLRSEFRRPRDILLTMVAEFLTKCTARLNEISKKSGQDSKSFELLDTKAHVVCTLDINCSVLTKGLVPSYYLQILCPYIPLNSLHVKFLLKKTIVFHVLYEGWNFNFGNIPLRLDTRTAGVTRQCSRKDGSFPYLHT